MIGTRPISDARVVLWDINDDGTMPDAPITETTTDASGVLAPVSLGVVDREVLVEVFGGTTEEMVSGEAITLDSTARLALMVTGLALDEKRTSVVVSPITRMAGAGDGAARKRRRGD